MTADRRLFQFILINYIHVGTKRKLILLQETLVWQFHNKMIQLLFSEKSHFLSLLYRRIMWSHRYQTGGALSNESPALSIAFNAFIGQRCLSSTSEMMQDAANIATNMKIKEIIKARRTRIHHGSFLYRSSSSSASDEFCLNDRERKKEIKPINAYIMTLHRIPLSYRLLRQYIKYVFALWRGVFCMPQTLGVLSTSVQMSRSVMNNWIIKHHTNKVELP